jgi:DNA polymerase IV
VRLFGPVPELARRIKREIRDELGLVASIGIAPVKFAAKIASDLGKPDGFVLVEPGGLHEPSSIRCPSSRLWGVGRIGERAMQQLGICTPWGRRGTLR